MKVSKYSRRLAILEQTLRIKAPNIANALGAFMQFHLQFLFKSLKIKSAILIISS